MIALTTAEVLELHDKLSKHPKKVHKTGDIARKFLRKTAKIQYGYLNIFANTRIQGSFRCAEI